MSKSSNIPSGRIAINRNGECLCGGPSQEKAFMNCSRSNSGLPCPLRNRLDLSTETQTSIPARVVGLFRDGCPTAIVRTVTKLIIVALQRMSPRWARPNIVEKVCRSVPAFANGNATSPVVFVFRVFRVSASIHHVRPRGVFGRIELAVNGLTLALKLLLIAAARNAAPILKTLAAHYLFVSTITATQPTKHSTGAALRVFVPNLVIQGYNRPTSKTPARNVVNLHGIIIA